MRYLFISLFLLLLRQGYSHNDIPKLQDYTIEVWSTDQGLPSNNLIRIDQDRKGFLWITSYNGLIRFDGNTFDIYNSEALPELKSNGFSFIAKARNNGMYFGTLTSGLLTFDGSDFALEKIENDFSGSINTIHTDKDNRLWIGVKNKGLYFKDNPTAPFTHIEHPLLENSIVQCIFEFKPGEMLIATDNHGVVYYNKGEFSSIDAKALDGLAINTLVEYKGRLHAGTNRGLYVQEEEGWRIISGTEGYFINSLKEDSQGLLYIASETGLLRINEGQFEYLNEENGLPSRQISSILIDNEENIWLTSKRGGLVQLRNSNFVNISVEDGLSNQYTNIIYELANGSVIVGNDNGGLDLVSENKVEKIELRTDLSSISIKDITEDSQGNIWVATYKGLLRISEISENLYTLEGGMVSLNIRSLFIDSKNNLWVGAKDGGIVKINSRAQRTIFHKENGLSDNYVFCFDELSDGRIIAGTYHGGLNIISQDNSVEVISIGTDTSSPLIFNLVVENDSTYWLATDVGLYRYHDGSFDRLDLRGGLLVTTIFDIHIDDYGYLWATSNMGLVRLRKTEIEAYFNGDIGKVNARLYDEKDGMISRECTGATKMLVSKDGKLWIPTSKGVTIVDPANIYVNEIVPPVYIKSIAVDDNSYTSNLETIILEPGSQRVKIDFTALSFYSPQKINFKYRLDGYDESWLEVGNQYEAVYMNLPEGKFTFEVMASNNDGYWNEVPAAAVLDVEPYFYTSRLFYLTLFGFVLVVVFIIYWIRIRVVEEKNRELHKLNAELDSFVYSVSHDLRAPLASILGLISVSKIDNDGKNLNMYLDKIETSVHKLDGFIKEIISYSRNVRMEVVPEPINLREMVDETLASLSYMNTDNAIEVTVESKEDPILHTDRTRLQVILNNIISNAYRYSKQYINDAFINIRITVINEKATIIVEDNGIGIKNDQQKKIFEMFYRASETSNGSGLGLYIARESADKIDGKISVESEYQKGSTFTVSLISL